MENKYPDEVESRYVFSNKNTYHIETNENQEYIAIPVKPDSFTYFQSLFRNLFNNNCCTTRKIII